MVAIKEQKVDMDAVLGTFVKGISRPRNKGVGSSNGADALTNGSDMRHSQYLTGG